jgi:hypothetical protein
MDVPGNVRTGSVGECSCYGSATGWYKERAILNVTLFLCTPCRIAGNGGTSPLILNFSPVQRSVLPAVPLHNACKHSRFILSWNWLDRLQNRAGYLAELPLLEQNLVSSSRETSHYTKWAIQIWNTKLHQVQVQKIQVFRMRRTVYTGFFCCMLFESQTPSCSFVWTDVDLLLFGSHSCDLSFMWLIGMWPPWNVETCC